MKITSHFSNGTMLRRNSPSSVIYSYILRPRFDHTYLNELGMLVLLSIRSDSAVTTCKRDWRSLDYASSSRNGSQLVALIPVIEESRSLFTVWVLLGYIWTSRKVIALHYGLWDVLCSHDHSNWRVRNFSNLTWKNIHADWKIWVTRLWSIFRWNHRLFVGPIGFGRDVVVDNQEYF